MSPPQLPSRRVARYIACISCVILGLHWIPQDISSSVEGRSTSNKDTEFDLLSNNAGINNDPWRQNYIKDWTIFGTSAGIYVQSARLKI